VVFTEKALAAKNALKLAQEIIATQGSDNLNETGYKTLANYARNIARGGTPEQKKEFICSLWVTRDRQNLEPNKNLYNYLADYFLKYCDKCFEESISLPPMKPLVEEATIPSSLCLR
jgi:hypothetical protein